MDLTSIDYYLGMDYSQWIEDLTVCLVQYGTTISCLYDPRELDELFKSICHAISRMKWKERNLKRKRRRRRLRLKKANRR